MTEQCVRQRNMASQIRRVDLFVASNAKLSEKPTLVYVALLLLAKDYIDRTACYVTSNYCTRCRLLQLVKRAVVDGQDITMKDISLSRRSIRSPLLCQPPLSPSCFTHTMPHTRA